MWGLGCLIWEVFNGTLPRTAALKSLGKVGHFSFPFSSSLLFGLSFFVLIPASYFQCCISLLKCITVHVSDYRMSKNRFTRFKSG